MPPGLIHTDSCMGTDCMNLERKSLIAPAVKDYDDERLTIPGWAGEITADELHFIKSKLKSSLGLRIRWGFKRSARRFSEKHIRQVARDGLEKSNHQF